MIMMSPLIFLEFLKEKRKKETRKKWWGERESFEVGEKRLATQ
jgi:hypothetical protein